MEGKAKFKKGDKVRVVDNGGAREACKVGDEFTVVRVEDGNLVYFTDYDAMFDYRFELVKAPTFKVGDRVRIARTEMDRGEVGDRGNVIAVGDDYVTVEFDPPFEGWGENGRGWIFFHPQSQLELVKPLTLEAGKFYTTRDGRRVGPMMRDWWGNFIEKEGDARLWKTSGAYIGKVGRDTDLISEAPAVTGNVAAEVDNMADEYGGGKSKPKFKVGDRVRHKDLGYVGSVTRIISDDTVKTFWTEQGWGGADHVDEIELLPTPPHAIVAVIEDGQPKPATRPYVHADRAAAKAEAERLAGVNKGKTFGVYELVDEVFVEKTYDHEWQRLAAGGDVKEAARKLKDAAGIPLISAKQSVDYWLHVAA